MNTLADLLNSIVSTLQDSPLFVRVQILETLQFSDEQFALKIRADLHSGDAFQVRLYCNREHTDYAYQLLRSEMPIIRWDNKEHFPSISSHPHHFHTQTGKVESSPLTGEPDHDLRIVLEHLTAHKTA